MISLSIFDAVRHAPPRPRRPVNDKDCDGPAERKSA
jgi:hypothetical protein